jgi:predicted N-formylglutamate amidohydrolase
MDIASAAGMQGDISEAGIFQPVTMVDGDPASGMVIICDHAGNRVPVRYAGLGLSQENLARHIAYDPGAGDVARGLARRLAAPAVLAEFSRLLIDPNRGTDDPTLIARLSDRTLVPGNAAIDTAERERRVAGYYQPYHAAVDAALDRAIAAGRMPAIVSIHSFTPVWRGIVRPWHAGVLWDIDRRLAEPLVAELRKDTSLVIGDNEPYSGSLPNDSMSRHGTTRGLAHVLVEIRHDLIDNRDGAEAWADRLAAILTVLNRRPELHELRPFRMA